ncbi:MAG: RNA methyltransferase [Cyanobacteria bacterium P01_H01_bin.58]
MLSSLKNPWIKQLRKLHQSKYRRSQQQFLLEGTHLLQAAIATQNPLIAVCATLQWQSQHPDLWQVLETHTERLELVSPEVLAAIATTATPDGVVGVAAIEDTVPSMEKIPHLGIAVEQLQDPGNLGTLIRTAAAVGSDGVWLSEGSVDLTHPKVLRSSAGQWFRVPKYSSVDLSTQLQRWQALGCQVLATAAEGTVPYWNLDFTQPTVIVLGNEGSGLSSKTLAAASQVISIPMINTVESLNVGVAAAIILFEALRQHHTTAAAVTH